MASLKKTRYLVPALVAVCLLLFTGQPVNAADKVRTLDLDGETSTRSCVAFVE